MVLFTISTSAAMEGDHNGLSLKPRIKKEIVQTCRDMQIHPHGDNRLIKVGDCGFGWFHNKLELRLHVMTLDDFSAIYVNCPHEFQSKTKEFIGSLNKDFGEAWTNDFVQYFSRHPDLWLRYRFDALQMNKYNHVYVKLCGDADDNEQFAQLR